MKFVQITTGQWRSPDGGRSFSIIALGEDGKVYTYMKGQGGWIAAPTKIVKWKSRQPEEEIDHE